PVDAYPDPAAPVVAQHQRCGHESDAVALKHRMKPDPDSAIVDRISKELGGRESLRTCREAAGPFIGAVASGLGFESERQRGHSRVRMNRNRRRATEQPAEIPTERMLHPTLKEKTQV